MPNIAPLQTSFTTGAIDPRLVGRTDLKAYAEGAARLENVWVTPGGGVRRRAGTRHLATVGADGRLAAVLLDDGRIRVFVLVDRAALVYEDAELVATISAPWTTAHLPRLAWAAHRGNLFVCHPQLPPQHVILEPYGHWRVLSWIYDTKPGSGDDRLVRLQPYAKYAAPEASLEAIPGSDQLWTFKSNQRVFDPGHVGTRLRFRGCEVAITSVAADRTTAMGIPQVTIDDPSRTFDWEEQAFSPVAGYPTACVVYRERLVVGGVPAMANRLWMSKIGRPFDFDTAMGLDDAAIAFALGADPAHAIRAFSAGRELEVYTTASEWTVDGHPLAPATTVASKQTGIGFFERRFIPPVSVDGASIFVGRGGDAVVEYVFADIDTAYQAQDVAVRARHLVREPLDLAFDPHRRLLILVDGEGRLATATLDRNAQMVAWSQQITAGRVRAAVHVGGATLLLVERDGTTRLERLDDALLSDASVTLEAAAPRTSWSGLDHLEGRTVALVADGVDVGDATVTGGAVATPAPTRELVVGLNYSHAVEPLPLLVDGRRRARRYRPIEIAFDVHATAAFDADIGEGLHAIALGDGAFSGRRRLRARGWRSVDDGPLWRIEGARPVPFHLLSATSDVKVTR